MMKEYAKTTFGTVTLDFIKQTPVWKHYADENGFIAREQFKNVLKACLYYLGFDDKHTKGYEKLDTAYVIRDHKDKTKGVRTVCYTFPVRQNFKYKGMYDNDILTGPVGENTKKVELSEFGKTFWDEIKTKRKKESSVSVDSQSQ